MAFVVARDLSFAHGADPRYWKWSKDPETGVEIAELVQVWWLEITGWVPVSQPQSWANYEAFLVYKLTPNPRNLESAKVSVEFVRLESPGNDNGGGETAKFPATKSDGWMKIKLGDYVNNHGNGGWVKMKFFETNDKIVKSGLIVLGMELRLKNT